MLIATPHDDPGPVGGLEANSSLTNNATLRLRELIFRLCLTTDTAPGAEVRPCVELGFEKSCTTSVHSYAYRLCSEHEIRRLSRTLDSQRRAVAITLRKSEVALGVMWNMHSNGDVIAKNSVLV